MAKVSIIVPIYNAEKHLERCIRSILSQTFTNFELLLIDDGSIDASGTICERFCKQDGRIKYFRKENSGASDTRNCGLKMATGEYLTFSDSDDWVESNWLSSMVENIFNTDLVIQGYVKHTQYGNTTYEEVEEGHIYKTYYSIACRKLLDNAHMGYLWSMLFKRKIIIDHNLFLYTKMSFHEDLEFILRYLLYTDSFKTIRACGYHYFFESKQYFHNISGCYSILLSLGNLLNDKDLNQYRRIYRTNAYNSLVFHKVTYLEITRARCFIKKFGRPCNGIKANVIYFVLLINSKKIVNILLEFLRLLVNNRKLCIKEIHI